MLSCLLRSSLCEANGELKFIQIPRISSQTIQILKYNQIAFRNVIVRT